MRPVCALGFAISIELQCHQINLKLFSHELLMKPSSLLPKTDTEFDGYLCLAYHEGYGSKLKNTIFLRMFLDGSISSNLGPSLKASLGLDLLF